MIDYVFEYIHNFGMGFKSEVTGEIPEHIASLAFGDTLPKDTKELVKGIPELGIDDEWLNRLDDVINTYESRQFVKNLEAALAHEKKTKARIELQNIASNQRERGTVESHEASERILGGDRKYEAQTLFNALEAAGDIFYTMQACEEKFGNTAPSLETKAALEAALLAFDNANGESTLANYRQVDSYLKDKSFLESHAYVYTNGKYRKNSAGEVVGVTDTMDLGIMKTIQWDAVRHIDVFGDLDRVNKGEFGLDYENDDVDEVSQQEKKNEAIRAAITGPKKFDTKYFTLSHLAEASQKYYEELLRINKDVASRDEIPNLEAFEQALATVQRAAETYHKLIVPAKEYANNLVGALARANNVDITINMDVPSVATNEDLVKKTIQLEKDKSITSDTIDRIVTADDSWLTVPLMTDHLASEIRGLTDEKERMILKELINRSESPDSTKSAPAANEEGPIVYNSDFWSKSLRTDKPQGGRLSRRR